MGALDEDPVFELIETDADVAEIDEKMRDDRDDSKNDDEGGGQ